MTEINKTILDDAIAILGKTYNSPKTTHIEHVISLLRESIHSHKTDLVATRADKITEVCGVFIPTGVPWIDTWLRGGLRPGELLLIGATPHAGKTHTLVWFGIQYLLEGHKVLSVIGEDLLSDVKAAYQKGIADPEALQNLWLADMQDVKFGVPEIEALYDRLVAEGNKPDIVIVDHVDLMKGVSGKQDWEVVSEVMVALKMFAKRTGCIIITASQANYGKELKGNERFYRAKVGKAANADVIIMIDDVVDNEYIVSLTKARGRKRVRNDEKTKTLDVDWDTMTIEELR